MCTACQKSINGMKRKKNAKKRGAPRRRARVGSLDSKSVTTMITQDLLPVGAGYLIGNYLPGILTKISPQVAKYSHYIGIGVGAVLGVTQKGMLSRVGLGLATNGVVTTVSDLIDGKVQGLGLLPPGIPSMRIAGVGNGYGAQQTQSNLEVNIQ